MVVSQSAALLANRFSKQFKESTFHLYLVKGAKSLRPSANTASSLTLGITKVFFSYYFKACILPSWCETVDIVQGSLETSEQIFHFPSGRSVKDVRSVPYITWVTDFRGQWLTNPTQKCFLVDAECADHLSSPLFYTTVKAKEMLVTYPDTQKQALMY